MAARRTHEPATENEGAMVRHYCSFLVRCWSLASGERRVRVEHVQTGEVLHAANLEDALAWIDMWANAALEDAPGTSPSVPPTRQGTPEPQSEPDDP